MNNKWALIVFSFIAIMVVQAAPLTQMDSKSSSVKFVFKQMGVAAEGQFKVFNANIQFDPTNVASSKIQFTIDLNSIETGIPGGDDEVKGKAWLAAKQFPQASFIATKITGFGNNQFSAIGNLTIKGISQTVTVPFKLNASTVDGQFGFKRLTFKIGEGEWADTSVVADDVVVKFNLSLK